MLERLIFCSPILTETHPKMFGARQGIAGHQRYYVEAKLLLNYENSSSWRFVKL